MSRLLAILSGSVGRILYCECFIARFNAMARSVKRETARQAAATWPVTDWQRRRGSRRQQRRRRRQWFAGGGAWTAGMGWWRSARAVTTYPLPCIVLNGATWLRLLFALRYAAQNWARMRRAGARAGHPAAARG